MPAKKQPEPAVAGTAPSPPVSGPDGPTPMPPADPIDPISARTNTTDLLFSRRAPPAGRAPHARLLPARRPTQIDPVVALPGSKPTMAAKKHPAPVVAGTAPGPARSSTGWRAADAVGRPRRPGPGPAPGVGQR